MNVQICVCSAHLLGPQPPLYTQQASKPSCCTLTCNTALVSRQQKKPGRADSPAEAEVASQVQVKLEVAERVTSPRCCAGSRGRCWCRPSAWRAPVAAPHRAEKQRERVCAGSVAGSLTSLEQPLSARHPSAHLARIPQVVTITAGSRCSVVRLKHAWPACVCVVDLVLLLPPPANSRHWSKMGV
jgi:hypothetical protein